MNHLYTRVSIRKYQDRPVEKEKTEAMLRAAMQAPSAANQQPWEFYVVTNKEKLKALSGALRRHDEKCPGGDCLGLQKGLRDPRLCAD